MNTFEKIYEAVKQIPAGKVSTYGIIANLSNMPRSAKIVGYALHSNPKPIEIPCHRVVNRFGKLSGSFAFGGSDTQQILLESEGVTVTNGMVDLEKYLYDPRNDFNHTRKPKVF